MQLKVICGFFFLLLGPVVTAPTVSAQTAIANVTIIDVGGGSTQHDMSVLISGERINVIGCSEKVQLPEQSRMIDGRGKFLLPGFCDMHVRTDGEDRVPRWLLADGITGIRDMAGDVAKLADSQRRVTSGELTGPRLVFADPMLAGPPSEADDWAWISHSPEQARDAIDRLVELPSLAPTSARVAAQIRAGRIVIWPLRNRGVSRTTRQARVTALAGRERANQEINS